MLNWIIDPNIVQTCWLIDGSQLSKHYLWWMSDQTIHHCTFSLHDASTICVCGTPHPIHVIVRLIKKLVSIGCNTGKIVRNIWRNESWRCCKYVTETGCSWQIKLNHAVCKQCCWEVSTCIFPLKTRNTIQPRMPFAHMKHWHYVTLL